MQNVFHACASVCLLKLKKLEKWSVEKGHEGENEGVRYEDRLSQKAMLGRRPGNLPSGVQDWPPLGKFDSFPGRALHARQARQAGDMPQACQANQAGQARYANQAGRQGRAGRAGRAGMVGKAGRAGRAG